MVLMRVFKKVRMWEGRLAYNFIYRKKVASNKSSNVKGWKSKENENPEKQYGGKYLSFQQRTNQPLNIVIINNKHATKGDFQKGKKEIGTWAQAAANINTNFTFFSRWLLFICWWRLFFSLTHSRLCECLLCCYILLSPPITTAPTHVSILQFSDYLEQI